MLSTDPKIANQQLMQANAGYWASHWPIRLQAGVFTFDGFEYQSETMASQSQRICYMKARQCFGATINES